jgi:hypothetical protein
MRYKKIKLLKKMISEKPCMPAGTGFTYGKRAVLALNDEKP